MSTCIRSVVIGVLAGALLLIAAPAFAHVGVETDNGRPGAQATYTVSVPNESESATTDRIEIQLPAGLEITDVAPGKGGWTMEAQDGVLVITGGRIQPGKRREFRFTAVNPRKEGEVTFPALQTYSDGEVVRWVGEEGSERPAPFVVLQGRPVPPPTEAPTTPVPTTDASEVEPTEAASPDAASPTPGATVGATPPAASEAVEKTDTGPSPALIALAVVAAIAIALALVARFGRRG